MKKNNILKSLALLGVFIGIGNLNSIKANALSYTNKPINSVNIGEQVVLNNDVKGYVTAYNAINNKSSKIVYGKNKIYFVYKKVNGSTNLTTVKGRAGSWVNNKNINVVRVAYSSNNSKKTPVTKIVTKKPVVKAPVKKAPVTTRTKWILPKNLGFRKTYMNYQAITNRRSSQYKFQNNGRAKTGSFGIRYYNGLPMIAISTRYANVGDIIEVKFSTGKVQRFFVGDAKGIAYDFYKYRRYHSYSYSYAMNWGIHNDNSIIEFITDRNRIDRAARRIGGFDNIYPGSIVSIIKLR